MELKKVKSSNLDMIGYDSADNKMMVQFKNGELYEYHGVDAQTYKDMMDATSIGQYFNKMIRGRHSYKKIGRVEEK